MFGLVSKKVKIIEDEFVIEIVIFKRGRGRFFKNLKFVVLKEDKVEKIQDEIKEEKEEKFV